MHMAAGPAVLVIIVVKITKNHSKIELTVTIRGNMDTITIGALPFTLTATYFTAERTKSSEDN